MLIKKKKLNNIFDKVLKLNSADKHKLNSGNKNFIKKLSFNNFQNWDSLNHVKIISKVEKIFKKEVNNANFQKLKSYDDFLKFIIN